MAARSKGRGTVAVMGLILVFVGVVGAVVLYVVSVQRPGQAIADFARGPVGCTTTLEFTETGTFYVFEEGQVADGAVSDDCDPAADPAREFGFVISDGGTTITGTADESIEYDTDGYEGRSVARFELDEPVTLTLEVFGDDADDVAAVGRNPDDGVVALRNGAIAIGVVGIVLGGLLLAFSGRRSKRAGVATPPTGPEWDARPPDSSGAPPAWPPTPPNVAQVPISPHRPDGLAPTPASNDAADVWAPPADSADADTSLPAPTLPDRAPSLPPPSGEQDD